MNKRLLTVGALTIATIVGTVGGLSLNAMNAFAQETQTPRSTQAPAATTQPQGQADPSMAPHAGANGKKEELLTGDTAEKVKAAAIAAVPGGTIQRVETDAEGSPYEAHMTKSDGTRVTVKVDTNFKVTSTEDGHAKTR